MVATNHTINIPDTDVTTGNQALSDIDGFTNTIANTISAQSYAATTAQSAATGMQNVLPELKYNLTPPTLSDGQLIVAQGDSKGNLRQAEQFVDQFVDQVNGVAATQVMPLSVSTYCASLFTYMAAAVTTSNVKATAGNLFSFTFVNNNAAARYIQFHNTATTPAGSAVPLLMFMAPANTTISIGREWFSAAGVNFTTGIAWAASTAAGIYTAATAADHFVNCQYK